MENSRINILGVEFDSITLGEAVSRGMDIAAKRESRYVVTPNPEIVLAAIKDESFKAALSGASLTLPDGIGVIYSSRILGTPIKCRVAGIDFASGMLEGLAKKGGSVFLFGAKPGVADMAAQKLSEKYAGLKIAGCENGYFTDDAPIIEHINAASPDFLLVCLGAEKQEKWMAENCGRLNAGLMAGLGGALDVFAGTVKRAPDIWIKLNLEWLYRLVTDPRRIKRMIKLPVILFKSVGCRLRRK